MILFDHISIVSFGFDNLKVVILMLIVHPGEPIKFEGNEFQDLLDENLAQTLKELLKILTVAETNIQKKGKWLPCSATCYKSCRSNGKFFAFFGTDLLFTNLCLKGALMDH